MTEHTSPNIVDHCDRLRWMNFLSAFTVKDTNILMFSEVSCNHLLFLGKMKLKSWLVGESEDFVVSLDSKLARAALTMDTRDFEVIGTADLCCHDQIDYSICKTG